MRCDEVQALLIEAADGNLPGPLLAELDGHLAGCDACRAEARALRDLLRTVATEPVPEPPAPYWATARQELVRRLGLQQPPPSWLTRLRIPLRPWALGGAAAALLLVIAAAFLASRNLPPDPLRGPTPDEAALLHNLEVVQDLELLEQVDILQHYELLRTFARRGRAT